MDNDVQLKVDGRAGENNYNARITADDVKEIRLAYNKRTQRDLAKEFGVTGATIWKIQMGWAWGHVHKELIGKAGESGKWERKPPLSKEVCKEIQESNDSINSMAKKYGVCNQVVKKAKDGLYYKEDANNGN